MNPKTRWVGKDRFGNTDFMKRNTNTVLQTYFDFSKIVMILLFLEHYRIARKIGIGFFEIKVVMKERNLDLMSRLQIISRESSLDCGAVIRDLDGGAPMILNYPFENLEFRE